MTFDPDLLAPPLHEVVALASALQHALEAQRLGHPFDSEALISSMLACENLVRKLEAGGLVPVARDGFRLSNLIPTGEEQ